MTVWRKFTLGRWRLLPLVFFFVIGIVLLIVVYNKTRASGEDLVAETVAELKDECVVDGVYDEDRLKNYFLSLGNERKIVKTNRGEAPLVLHVIDEMIWDNRLDEDAWAGVYEVLESNKDSIGFDITRYFQSEFAGRTGEAAPQSPAKGP